MTRDRVSFLIFPAVAMSLGWAFRGFIGGGPLGAMIPGAMVALALLWLLDDGLAKVGVTRWGLVAAFGAVGIGYGGQMTYGQTVGLASDVATMPWGLLGLTMKGAVWGLLGGATLGLALTLRRYSRTRVLVALAAMLVATWMGWLFVNHPKLIYFSNRLDRPREEVWFGLFAGAVAMMAVLLWNAPNVTLVRFAVGSFIGGGLGFGLGGALLAAGRNSGFDNTFWPWWKGMEYTFGLLFGLAMGWAAWQSREELAEVWHEAAPRRGLLDGMVNKQEPMYLFFRSRGYRLPFRFWQVRAGIVLTATILLLAAGVWFEYTADIRFGYSVAGAVLLAAALFSETLAWHIAVTMTCFAFLLDLAEAFAGDLAFGPMWVGVTAALAGSLAVWFAVERIRSRGDAVLPRMFLLVTLAAFAVTVLKTAMQAWRAPGPHVEFWMFVGATFVVWRMYRGFRRRMVAQEPSGI